MDLHVDPFAPLDNCEMRTSPPGNVFWENIKESEYFVLQLHKAENKPQIVGNFMKGLKRFLSSISKRMKFVVPCLSISNIVKEFTQ